MITILQKDTIYGWTYYIRLNPFSKPKTQAEIDKRVTDYGRIYNLPERPILVSGEASLMFSEIVLANRDK